MALLSPRSLNNCGEYSSRFLMRALGMVAFLLHLWISDGFDRATGHKFPGPGFSPLLA
jgi:hypothetical protein